MEPKDILNNIEQYYILNQKKDHLLDANNLIAILKLNQEQIVNTISNLEIKEKELNDKIFNTINEIIAGLNKVYEQKLKTNNALREEANKNIEKAELEYNKYISKLFKNEQIIQALKNDCSLQGEKLTELNKDRDVVTSVYQYICKKLNEAINNHDIINESLKHAITKYINAKENDYIINLYNNLLELIVCKKELAIEISEKIKLNEENKKEIEGLEEKGNKLKEELENSKEIDIKQSLIELNIILNKVNEHDKIIKDIKNFLTKCGGFTTEIYKKAGSAVKVATSVASGNAEEVFDTCVDEIGNSLGINPKITSNGKVLVKNMYENLKKMKNEKNENKQDNNEE